MVPLLHGKQGEKVEVVTNFLFLTPKSLWTVTTGHEIRGQLLSVRKAMTNQDSVLKNRDTTLP